MKKHFSFIICPEGLKHALILCCILVFLQGKQAAWAQPANDQKANATIISNPTGWCSATAEYTTTGATADASRGNCQAAGPNNNVWFKFTAATSRIQIQLSSGVNLGTLKRPYLSLWLNNTQIACKAYVEITGIIELTALNLIIGNEYFISVDNLAGSSNRGTFTLCVDDSPFNDFTEEAFEIPSFNNWCSNNSAYSNVKASPDQNKSTCQALGPNKNVWFKFTATSTRVLFRLKIGGSLGTLSNGYLALWNSNLTQIGCVAYISASGNMELASEALTIGNVYYLSVDNLAGQDGTFTLCASDQVDNNFKEGATELTQYSNYLSPVGANSTDGATPDHNAGSCWGSGPNNNRWFKFTAPSSSAKIDLIPSGMTTPLLALWNANLTQIGCAKFTGSTSTITINATGLTVGQVYYLSVDNTSGNAGGFRIGLDFTTSAGTLTGSKTVCNVLNSGKLSLSGHIGSVVRWQSSINNGITWVNISNTTDSLNYTNVALTTRYRAVIKNGSWPEVNSNEQIISVALPPVIAIDTSSVSCGSMKLGVATARIITGVLPYTYTWSNSSTSNSISNLSSGVYTLTVTDNSGCTATASANIVAIESINPGAVSGISPVCSGTGQSLTLSGHSGNVLKWQSSTDGGATWTNINNTTSILTVSNVQTTTLYRAEVQESGCGIKATNPFELVIRSKPVPVFSTSNVSCFGGNNGSLSVSSVTGSAPFIYLWNVGITTASLTNLSAGTYTITVTDINGCTNTTNASVSQPPKVTTAVAGLNQSLCDAVETTMSANIPAVGVGRWVKKSGSGNILNENDPFTRITGLSVGISKFEWIISNGICDSSLSEVNIVVDSAPLAGLVTIDHPVKACIGDTITVSTQAPGTDFLWTVEPAGTFISGQGFSSSQVVLGYTPTSSFNLCVTVANGCGVTPVICQKVRHRPAFPAAVSAPQAVCAGQSTVFSVDAESAAQYRWTGPAGMLFNSQPSPFITSLNTVSVYFPNGFTTGDFYVAATSGCNYTDEKKFSVSAVPVKPGVISGKKSNVCNSTELYTTKARDGKPFVWTAPSGASISSVSDGTDSVWVSFGPAFKSGKLTVIAQTPCGIKSDPVSLAITNAPATPSAVTGSFTVCPNTTNNIYSVKAMPEADSFEWSVRDNAIINNQGNREVTIDFGASVKQIIVSAKSSCGTSTPRKQTLTISTGCRTGIPDEPLSSSNQVENETVGFNLQAFPDVDQKTITFTFNASVEQTYTYKLLDKANQEVRSGMIDSEIGANMFELDLNGVTQTIFSLVIENGTGAERINVSLK